MPKDFLINISLRFLELIVSLQENVSQSGNLPNLLDLLIVNLQTIDFNEVSIQATLMYQQP